MSADSRALRRALQAQGYAVRRTKGDHLRVSHPDRRGVVFLPCTPSDHRSLLNAVALLRRELGFRWRGH